MTSLLEKAFAEASKLSPNQQEDFARWMLAELANMRQWNQIAIQTADAMAWMDENALQDTYKLKSE